MQLLSPDHEHKADQEVIPYAEVGHEGDVERMKDTEVEEIPQRTLGTMLMELGITLRWNEAEEVFVDK